MTLTELLVVAVMAAVWWIPTFMALTDLQTRSEGVPRPVLWKWLTLMCVPVVGALLYRRKGRDELDAARSQASSERKPGSKKKRTRR